MPVRLRRRCARPTRTQARCRAAAPYRDPAIDDRTGEPGYKVLRVDLHIANGLDAPRVPAGADCVRAPTTSVHARHGVVLLVLRGYLIEPGSDLVRSSARCAIELAREVSGWSRWSLLLARRPPGNAIRPPARRPRALCRARKVCRPNPHAPAYSDRPTTQPRASRIASSSSRRETYTRPSKRWAYEHAALELPRIAFGVVPSSSAAASTVEPFPLGRVTGELLADDLAGELADVGLERAHRRLSLASCSAFERAHPRVVRSQRLPARRSCRPARPSQRDRAGQHLAGGGPAGRSAPRRAAARACRPAFSRECRAGYGTIAFERFLGVPSSRSLRGLPDLVVFGRARPR